MIPLGTRGRLGYHSATRVSASAEPTLGSRSEAVTPRSVKEDAVWPLRQELLWAHALVWIAQHARGGELLPEVHLFFADRYGRLARCYSRRGNTRKARLYDDLAAFHWNASGPNQPEANAAVMPVPARPSLTRAVARYPNHSDDAA